MFYIQVVQRRWDKPERNANKKPRNSQLSEAELQSEKTHKFAQTKTREYIHNAQKNHYLERRVFF